MTGHRNPDLDSIGSAIGYAELKQRLHPEDEYIPVRLGEVNAQTAWALRRARAEEPEFLPHIELRVMDVMQPCAYVAQADDPVRSVGLAMAARRLDMVPVVGPDGALAGVLAERDLARLYIRESQGASDFRARPVGLDAIVEVLGGEVLVGEQREVAGRLWVLSMDPVAMAEIVGEGDIAIVGNLAELQRAALEDGVALLVTSNGVRPGEDILELARARGASVVVSPLDSYVSARMIQLSAPVGRLMNREPLTVSPDDVLSDVTRRILEVDYRAAIVTDRDGAPAALVSRSDLVDPQPRHILLVDHAEQGQSVPGIEHAHIVEILDHHHIGSIETRVPVMATFDPVGSTATLVVERFRAEGREPRESTATMLLAATLSDTVILTSPTTTDRDRRVVAYLEESLGLDATAFGMEMFEASSDVSRLSGEEIVRRDAKHYERDGGETLLIAQVEVVGGELLARRDELQAALDAACAGGRHALAALMITDIVRKATALLVSGDREAAERAFGTEPRDGYIDLPGVMSRKKQVAPRLLAAAG